jgi:ABC-2 type transport system ATP-binding protein
VQVAGPAEAVLAEVRRIAGVLSVEQKSLADGIGTYVVESIRDRDVRPELSRALVGKGWGLLDLRPIDMTLEEIFIKLVTEEPVGATSPPDEAGE